ncbi:hypothetical protein B6N42_00120 [Cutibacterium avidum]|nr:hypothetical protein B6N42_00120 [Cutibacterium avidum]
MNLWLRAHTRAKVLTPGGTTHDQKTAPQEAKMILGSGPAEARYQTLKSKLHQVSARRTIYTSIQDGTGVQSRSTGITCNRSS